MSTVIILLHHLDQDIAELKKDRQLGHSPICPMNPLVKTERVHRTPVCSCYLDARVGSLGDTLSALKHMIGVD